MKNKETYFIVNREFVRATKWMIIKKEIHRWITRFKFVDSWKYRFIPNDEMKYHFVLSPKEYEDAQKIYKEKGTISYTFYPIVGISWGVKLKVLKTDEIIDITDVSPW